MLSLLVSGRRLPAQCGASAGDPESSVCARELCPTPLARYAAPSADSGGGIRTNQGLKRLRSAQANPSRRQPSRLASSNILARLAAHPFRAGGRPCIRIGSRNVCARRRRLTYSRQTTAFLLIRSGAEPEQTRQPSRHCLSRQRSQRCSHATSQHTARPSPSRPHTRDPWKWAASVASMVEQHERQRPFEAQRAKAAATSLATGYSDFRAEARRQGAVAEQCLLARSSATGANDESHSCPDHPQSQQAAEDPSFSPNDDWSIDVSSASPISGGCCAWTDAPVQTLRNEPVGRAGGSCPISDTASRRCAPATILEPVDANDEYVGLFES